MKARTGSLAPSVAFLYVVGIVGKSVVGMEEAPSSSMSLQHYNTMLNSLGLDEPMPDKRAYTYVSQDKRLPVYNFGIGKRFADNNDNKRGREYSFGLGKRTRQYSFGLGKRNDNVDYPVRLNLDYIPFDGLALHSQESLDDILEEKRGRQPYNFGLGKRSVHFSNGQSMGSGKRPNDVLSQRYHFGLGKRMSDDEEEAMQ
ncbi:unnamed protein product [Xylocopa violacea]|uniref:Uncharacterized protein n=1 Tax=Xylocopa violacea TaxID=135666 RepID=A0ABP1NGZ5_XYLVO